MVAIDSADFLCKRVNVKVHVVILLCHWRGMRPASRRITTGEVAWNGYGCCGCYPRKRGVDLCLSRLGHHECWIELL
jgi:hypothetical protein